MILAHTIFGKPKNDIAVTKEELFIMFRASQGRPVNIATFILANFDRIIEHTNRRICISDFVTLLARAIGHHTHLDQCVSFGAPLSSRFRYMDIPFCFDRNLIANLGPATIQLLINHALVHDFTLPNPERTNIHDKNNWLYD
ncbi:DNA (cytosine-5)-methyltransferase [Trifolium repens]|nr:DNA (cytosine-5)-methyltransferase [Trifolium repens]